MAKSKQGKLLKIFQAMIIQESSSIEEAQELAVNIAVNLKLRVTKHWPQEKQLGNSDYVPLPGKIVSFHEQQRLIVANACSRARHIGLPATLTLDQWLKVLNHFDRTCAYCRSSPYQVLEHFIELSLNNKDGGTTISNCVPACRSCNTRKARLQLTSSAIESVRSYLNSVHELFPFVNNHPKTP